MPKSTIARRAPERATTPGIEAAIVSWQPQGLDPAGWSAVEDFVRDAVRRLHPRTAKAARWQLWLVARFVVWAHSVGVPLELERQFTPAVVHRYCEVALRGSPGTRRTVRHQLILFARNLTVTAPWPPVLERIRPTRVSAPYSEGELRLLEAAVGAQATELRTRRFGALLALGAGCGLDARWAVAVLAGDVTVTSAGVSLSVRNPDRIITCLRRFEHHLEEFADHAGGSFFRPQQHLSEMVSRLEVSPECPRLSLSRLRTTWLLEHLRQATPLGVLLDAAGLETSGSLDELVSLIPATDPERAQQLLRGSLP